MLKNITYISAAKKERKVKKTSLHIKMKRIDGEMHFVFFFFTGILAGTLLLNLFMQGDDKQLGLYSNYFMDQLKHADVTKRELFFYSFGNRSREILCLLFLCITSLGKVLPALYLFYKGLTIGILVSTYVVQYQVGGIMLYLLSVFPHYITYIIMVLILISFSREIYTTAKNFRGQNTGEDGGNLLVFMKKKIPGYLKCLFLLFLLNAVTSYLEVFVNLSIMKNILN